MSVDESRAAAPVERVGFVGLGNMGAPMAEHLLRAGYEVVVYDLDPSRAERLAPLGARPAQTLRELAEASEAALLALPGPKEVEAAAGEVLPALAAGCLLVNLSTISVRLVRELEQAASERGVSVVDAPVSGAADGAQEGVLTLMVGADPDVLVRARPLLEAIGRTIVHMGPVGTGTAAKLSTNLLWFVQVVALVQALALGTKAGIAPRRLADLIPATAGSSWAANHDLLNIIRGDDDERFTLALCRKDLTLINELAADVGLDAPLAAYALEQFAAAGDRFGLDAGQLAVARLTEEAAQVSIRAPGAEKALATKSS